MPGLAEQLAPYLKPLNGIRVNPYTTMSGRRGEVLAVGSPDGGYRANGSSPDGMVGDSGEGAQFDRALAAEANAQRSADLTNWLDRQAAQRVPERLERDDPEAAARVRGMQMAALRPETPSRVNTDALEKMLQFGNPQAASLRQRAIQEKIQGDVAGANATREADAAWFNSPTAQGMRRTTSAEARTNARRAAEDELDLSMDPRAIAGRMSDLQGRLSVAKANNPPDALTLAYQANGQGAKTATWAEIEAVASERGVTPKVAAEYARKQGYTIVD